jgi:MFS family permease
MAAVCSLQRFPHSLLSEYLTRPWGGMARHQSRLPRADRKPGTSDRCHDVWLLLSSFCGGFVCKKLGLGTALLGGTGIASLGVALSTTATGWHTLMSSMFLVGVGAGLLDAGINSYAAASLSGRLVNWLHSTYGLGAILSPLLITVLYRFGGSWRIAYAILSLGFWVLCFLIFRTRKAWSAPTPGDHAHARLTFDNYRETLRKPICGRVSLCFLSAPVCKLWRDSGPTIC